jgi:hypothetical protein
MIAWWWLLVEAALLLLPAVWWVWLIAAVRRRTAARGIAAARAELSCPMPGGCHYSGCRLLGRCLAADARGRR